ncbi:sensor histidine kinase [Paenibacillus polymyxa]|uniref:cache domain-containing sensor histidine kinase n=1 Tax=Paenibacillus polymyxa TaxID=1406 RepID=UPI0004D7612C|nr:sensor histidine kinase [Paenibacillus polymyxa]KEO79977.1 histidine kinase [Paenibacillus polymyxa]MCH6186077.1 sensor histidine kinase [Paenibacillus polymyxa]WRL60913.1 sensor histidine kinase [Paenibacillus polymyxa]
MGGRGRQKFAGIPTIRGKFIVLTLVLTVIPMVVLTFTFYRIAAHSIGEKSEALAMQSRQMSENYVNATLSDLNDLTNAILSNPDVQSTLETKPEDDYEYLRSDETLSMVVRTQTQTKPYITSSLIYAANGGLKHSLYQGNVSVRFGGLPTLEEARVYYRRLLAERPMMWMAHSPFESGRGMAEDRIYVGKLLRKTTGDYAPLGFLLLEIDKASLFRGLAFHGTDGNTQMWVLDQEGEPVYRLPEQGAADQALLRQIAKSAVDRPVLTKDWRTWNGRQTMISYGPLNEGQWTLLQKVDQSVLFEDARKIGAWTIWTFLIALMLGWMLSYRLSDTIRRPLLQLSRLMAVDGSVSATGLAQAFEAPTSVVFNPKDEVGQIGERFLHMMQKNHELYDQVYEALLSRKQAEFRALQAQINPHFLYNTLESLKGMALANGQRDMAEVIGAFGKCFRISLSYGREQISLGQEVEHVSAYVKVQQFRFRNSFEWICEVEEDICGFYVPKLILQPLVENAIYHGLKGRTDRGYIMLSGTREGDMLRLTVSDDGGGIGAERLDDIRKSLEAERGSAIGFGLRNVHERLRHYGPQYGLSVTSEPGQYTSVTLLAPIRTE